MKVLLAGVLFGLATGAAIAADAPQKLEPIPEPPSLGDPALEPDVTIRNRGQDRVEEYRIRGQLYMVKITPRIGRPYYLIKRTGEGQWSRVDGLDANFVVPQWVIKTW